MRVHRVISYLQNASHFQSVLARGNDGVPVFVRWRTEPSAAAGVCHALAADITDLIDFMSGCEQNHLPLSGLTTDFCKTSFPRGWGANVSRRV